MAMPMHRYVFKDVYKVVGILFSFVGLLDFLIGCFLLSHFIKGGLRSQEVMVGLVFSLTGFLVFCFGAGILLLRAKRKKNQKFLKENGRKIYATVVSIEMDFQISNNYRHPYVLSCEYTDGSGNVHQYKTEPIMDDRIDERVIGTLVPVYVAKENLDDYYVDYRYDGKSYN